MQRITPYSRRAFLQILASASVFAATPARALRSAPEQLTVSILHTTDLHGNILPTSAYGGTPNLGGLARCATQIRIWKQENPFHILVDAGDLYQGTQVGLQTRGKVMIDALNHLGYDAWVLGNHEFDWGIKTVHEAITRSDMRVLGANCVIDGKPAGWQTDRAQPRGQIAPFVFKRVGGFRIGIIGVATPGMPYWFHESLYRGIEFVDPVPPVRRAIGLLRERDADAILLVGHMGQRRGGDDFANRTQSLLEACPEVSAFIGGHTHQHVAESRMNGTPFTQAGYFGINLGRLDITFDRNTRRVLSVQPSTAFMNDAIALDPALLSLAQPDIDRADAVRETPVGILSKTLSIARSPQTPSPVEQLIGAAIFEALETRGIQPDAVLHGLIFPDGDLQAGPKTIADMWKLMPYENHIVTAQVTRDDLFIILSEALSTRSVMGIHPQAEGTRGTIRIQEIYDRNGTPLQRNRRYRIALNSYDAASAGRRLLQLREILQRRDSRTQLHPVLTRNALIDYFTRRETVPPVTRFAPPPQLTGNA